MIGKINISSTPFKKREVLIHFVFKEEIKGPILKTFDRQTSERLFVKVRQEDFKGEDEIISLEKAFDYQLLVVVGLGPRKDFNWAKFRDRLADGLRFIYEKKYTQVELRYFEALGNDNFSLGKNLSLALHLANYNFDYYKSRQEKKKIKKIEVLNFFIPPSFTKTVRIRLIEQGITYGRLLSEGIYLTRDLINEPANKIDPIFLEQVAFQIEKNSSKMIRVDVLDEDECRHLGMNAFLAVAQGSEKKPKFIILKYQKPNIKNQNNKSKIRKICLIGKSITFDSGGLSLKPSEAMETMKIDMAGGATILGIFKILSALEKEKIEVSFPSLPIYGILPACENMPSGKAIKPGDIVTSLNGKTIEILNTDAEGRLTLADALSYAEKYLKPEIIIDFATLTGACMIALGKEITGFWGNDENFINQLLAIAKNEGENLWQLPLYRPYLEKMKSKVADIKNVGEDRFGGAIIGALFLSEFVKKTSWIHFDIAGSCYNQGKPKGIISEGATGWGIITLMEFLRQCHLKTS